jgi:diacylglycerol kinase (ATP)
MQSENNRFSIVRRAKSFTHAFRGIGILLKTTHNAWIHCAVFVVVVVAGVYFNIAAIEWALLFLASGLVFVTEAINTAIEIDMDLTSPQYHPYAKDTKDVAAGAVLLAAMFAVVVGILIFSRYVGETFDTLETLF